MTLGQVIFRIRKDKRMLQQTVAEEVGISQSYLSAIEADQKLPTVDLLEKISKVLETPLPFIFFLTFSERHVSLGKRNAFRLLYPHLVNMLNELIQHKPEEEY